MTTVLVFVLMTALSAVVGWLVVGEISGAVNDWLAQRVRRAAAILPPELAEDLEAEWIAELGTLKDRPRKAISFTRGIQRAALEIARDVTPAALATAAAPAFPRQDAVRHALDRLPEREREVVRLRYGIDGNDPVPLREVGRRFGVSAEEVRALERRIWERLGEDRDQLLEAMRHARKIRQG